MKRYTYDEFLKHFLPRAYAEMMKPKTPKEIGKAIAESAIENMRKALRKIHRKDEQ